MNSNTFASTFKREYAFPLCCILTTENENNFNAPNKLLKISKNEIKLLLSLRIKVEILSLNKKIKVNKIKLVKNGK